MSTTRLTFATHSTQIQGARSNQEDSYDVGVLYTGEQGELEARSCRHSAPPASYDGIYAIVADGMGGHDDGEKASAAVVQYFPVALARTGNLRDAAEMANNHLGKLKARGEIAANAGCTLVACMLRHNKWLSTVSVGDSYILMQRGDNVEQLNDLHTRGAQLDSLVLAGQMSAEDAAREGRRGALTSAIMGRPLAECDYKDEETYAARLGELRRDDRILLTSDGVLTFGLDNIRELCQQTQGQSPKSLVNGIMRNVEGINHPKQDNATIVCLQGISPDGPAFRPEALGRFGKSGGARPPRQAVIVAGGAVSLLMAIGAGYMIFGGEDPQPNTSTGSTEQTQPAGENQEKPDEQKQDNEQKKDETQTPAPAPDDQKKEEVKTPTPENAAYVKVDKESGSMSVANTKNEAFMLSKWKEWANKDASGKPVFEAEFNASPDKAQTLLQLIYAWQNTGIDEKTGPVKAELAKLIDETIARSEFNESPELKIVKAYYLSLSEQAKDGQQPEWVEDFPADQVKNLKKEVVKDIAKYLAAKYNINIGTLAPDISYTFENGKLSCSDGDLVVACGWAKGCTEQMLAEETDDASKASSLALLVIVAEADAKDDEVKKAAEQAKKLLKDIQVSPDQPNSSLLLCYYRARTSKNAEWTRDFYKVFVDQEPAVDERYVALRQPLFEKLLVQGVDPTWIPKLVERYNGFSEDAKISFLSQLVKIVKVQEWLMKRISELKERSKEELPDDNKNAGVEAIKEVINTWSAEYKTRLHLFLQLIPDTHLYNVIKVKDEELSLNILTVLTANVVVGAEKEKIENFFKELSFDKTEPHYLFVLLARAYSNPASAPAIRKEEGWDGLWTDFSKAEKWRQSKWRDHINMMRLIFYLDSKS